MLITKYEMRYVISVVLSVLSIFIPCACHLFMCRPIGRGSAMGAYALPPFAQLTGIIVLVVSVSPL